MTDNLFGCVTSDSFGTGIPTDDLPPRVQHEDGVVLDSVEEHAIFFLAIPECCLRKSASGAVALDAPSCGSRDQQGQNGSENQNNFGLAQMLLRVHVAQRQQSQLFVLQLANFRLKLIHEPRAPSASNGIRCGLQTLDPAQTSDPFSELDLLGSQPFQGLKMALLFGIIHGQVARDCLVLFQA